MQFFTVGACAPTIIFPRDYIEGETPVPIPNTVVKPLRADGTGLETGRESRTLRGFFYLRLNFFLLVFKLFNLVIICVICGYKILLILTFG